jgi:magnesium-transporting ATPase (P-type)
MATTDATNKGKLEVEEDDVELGSHRDNGATSHSFVCDQSTTPTEPYLTVSELAQLHRESRIHLDKIEMSGGLSETVAEQRLLTYGSNRLTPPPRMPEWKRFLMQFQNVFLILLNVCGLLAVVAYLIQRNDIINVYLAIVLFVVVFLTAYIQFHEEGKAYAVIDSFTKMLASNCTVIRDYKRKTIPTEQLALGDIILIQNGDKVPADAVILLCRNLKVRALL